VDLFGLAENECNAPDCAWKDVNGEEKCMPAGGRPHPHGPGQGPGANGPDCGMHTTEADCWVAVNGKVLNVSSFLDEHPGGKEAIMLYAGKDASEEFNMMHDDSYIAKYAPQVVIGKLKGGAKL